MTDLSARILEELSYSDLTEAALKKRLKAPVHRELATLAHEGRVKKVEHRGEEMWALVSEEGA